jgi:Rrf2 family protein
MKISAQEEYGLRCILQLARAEHGSVVTVKEIAQKEALSTAYVEKLLRMLAKAGLVHSLRGVRGGYILNRPPSQVTLGEVVGAMGQVPSTEHICHQFTGTRQECIHFSNCGIRSVWSGLTTYIQGFLDHTTLDSLLGDEFVVSNRLAKNFAR